MNLTFHLVAGSYFRDCNPNDPYTPESFADEGFIHCTDGVENVAAVANRYYSTDQRMYIVLAIDKDALTAEVRYEDPEAIYPHIYGALNRDAIVKVLPILRRADGTFLPPDVLL